MHWIIWNIAVQYNKHCQLSSMDQPQGMVHKKEFIRWMEATGLVSEFEVIIREHLCPPKNYGQ